MIKFVALKEDRPMIGFGLSRGNCEKLIEGKPIFIDLKVMMAQCDEKYDFNDATVLIFGGDNEQQMVDDFKRNGFDFPSIKTHNEEN